MSKYAMHVMTFLVPYRILRMEGMSISVHTAEKAWTEIFAPSEHARNTRSVHTADKIDIKFNDGIKKTIFEMKTISCYSVRIRYDCRGRFVR